MRVILLGGSGFLGSNIAIYLANQGFDVIIADLVKNIDIMKNKNIEFMKFEFQNFSDYSRLLKKDDIVIHLVSIPTEDILSDVRVNILPTIHLLDSCVAIGVKKLVFASSGGTVYGNQEIMPLHEECNLLPLNKYGLQKLTIENYIRLYNLNFGLAVNILRISNPYGGGQKPFHSQGIIPTIIASVILKKEIEVWGDGEDIRDYIYIEDFLYLLKKIILSKENYLLMNIASGKGVSVNDLIKLVFNITGKHVPVTYIKEKETLIRKNILDISRIKKVAPSFKVTPLDDGILKMLNSWNQETNSFDIQK